RHHVLEELDVAGRIDDDVVARVRLEERAGGIDGDALRLLVLQCVQQERELERTRIAGAIFTDALELAFGQRVRVGEQTADDGALAVVHMAHDHDVHAGAGRTRSLRGRSVLRPYLRARTVIRQIFDIRGHHMYPSRRSVSSPPSSLSCARPERSAMLANLPVFSSSTISETFRASESTMTVQGAQPS